MKKMILCTGLVCASMWGAASEGAEKKEETAVVCKVDETNIHTAVSILLFMQQAKATQSMPDEFIPGKVTPWLQTLHITGPSHFEAVYSGLTGQVLTWTEQNLLPEKPKE